MYNFQTVVPTLDLLSNWCTRLCCNRCSYTNSFKSQTYGGTHTTFVSVTENNRQFPSKASVVIELCNPRDVTSVTKTTELRTRARIGQIAALSNQN